MSRFSYEFVGKVAALPIGRWTYSVVYLPKAVAEQLPMKENPRLRIRGELGEFPFHGAWQPTGCGWYLKLSQDFLKKAECGIGDWVNVRFNIDDQDAVDLPDALAEALEHDAEFKKAWEALSPGKRRSYILPTAQAKGLATIAKRLAELRALVMAE